MDIYSTQITTPKPYVYKLTHKETNQFYFGYREANKLPGHLDLPKYKTSSDIIKLMGFENFNWEIIKEYDSWQEAYDSEQLLIKENWADPLILNEQFVDIESGKKRFRTDWLGRKHKPESIEKIGKASKGRVGWCGTVDRYDPRLVASIAKGKETKARRKAEGKIYGSPIKKGERICITDGITDKHIKIDDEIPEGWHRGIKPRTKEQCENLSKSLQECARKNKLLGIPPNCAKKVICVETNKIFLTTKEAAISIGFKTTSLLKKAIKENLLLAGFHWKFV